MSREDLRGWFDAATAAWPGVVVPEDAFGAYVRERLHTDDGAERQAALHIDDLYLACACARGDEPALAAFERAILPEVDAALRRFASTLAPDEIKQLVRHRLFVGGADARPKILEYAGRGRLRTWVRVAATRVALNLAESSARERTFEQGAIEHILGAGGDPELAYLKRRYGAEFRASFGEAFSALDPRERNLLRYAFGEGLSVDAVGALYGVHRATAARWITKAHATLVEQVQRTMRARLHLDKDEYASILRLIESQIEISFERYLGSPAPQGAG
ncbi:MAG TPA: hypothetical protein VGM56_18500 [Byssovorax sp.]|jgi:RNA polymerase sigma-70 factor (ECF subfamily)